MSSSSSTPRLADSTSPSEPAPAQLPARAPILRVADLIDGPAIAARLAEAAKTTESREELKGAAVAMLKAAQDEGRARIKAALKARPMEGRAASRAIAALTDEIVRLAFGFCSEHLHPLSTPTKAQRISVIAVGGYGRLEMAPFSDVDLLFLTPYKQTAWGESLIESILYILWDLRLKVGQSVRTVDECLRLGREDFTIRTSLLEHRFICGDRGLSKELDKRLWSELFAKTGPEFVEAKLVERAARHERHGGSRYLVEPNVKESKGGLRDLQTLFWIAKYLYHADDSDDLVRKGVFTADEAKIFSAAESFLWTVRCHLHFIAGRPVESLTFDMQVEIANALGYQASEGQRGVERFMQRYFNHAKDVGELTRIFLAALEQQHVKKRPGLGALMRAFTFGKQTSGGFALRGGRLAVEDDAFLRDDPVNILRLFDEGLRTGALVHPTALRMVAAHLDLVDDKLRNDPVANQIFLNLLLGNKNPERALRRMNETGFLGAFIPEFGHIVALMQFNMYHHYTVDEHTIQCIATLAKIEREELVEALPVASRILKEGVNRRVLYTALLLHDIGKGRPEDHSIAGAEIAARLCPRLGLDEATTATVEWLVRHHLLMSDVAQKRDISDPATVRAFADVVRSPDRLKLLIVLTACDIMAVGPGVWNNWKAQLLRQLYRDTRDVLTGGNDEQSVASREKVAQEALRKALKGWSKKAIAAEIARHYRPYWLGFDTDTQKIFAELGRRTGEDEVGSDIAADPSRDATRACFYMADHPGIFSRLAGALALAGANVVDARTFTTGDGYAASVFWIQDREGRPYEAARLDRLRRAVDRSLKGEVITGEALKPKRKVKKRESGFRVPTRIVFDNESSELYTVIEVDTRDRVGLLYDLTRALASCNVSIFSAIIATYGEQAVDVFYIKDLFGLKVRGDSKKKIIEKRVREAIDNAAPDSESK